MPSPEFERLNKKLHSLPVLERTDPQVPRDGMEQAAKYFNLADTVTAESFDLQGTPAEWLRPEGSDDEQTLVYYHGGGYVMGSLSTHRHMVGDMAKASGWRTLTLDYRLAPENPYPAGLEDSLKAYRWLLENGCDPSKIILSGDSAGGGMTLAVLLSLRDAGDPLPAAAVLLSPWTDITGSGESMKTKRDEDPVLRAGGTDNTASWYAGDKDHTDPLISPLFADLAGLPPMLIQVGTAEILLDDSTRLAEKAKAAGVEVDLDVWDEMIHVWQWYSQWIPEGQEAIERMAAYMEAKVG